MLRITLLIFLFILGSALTEVQARVARFRLVWNDNPSTTMTIAWDQLEGRGPRVYYDIVDHGRDTSLYAFRHGVDAGYSYRGMENRFSRLKSLEPGQVYYFVIADNEEISARYWFKTAPGEPTERLSLIAGGDSRNNRSPRRSANILVSKLRPHAVLFDGDMTAGDTDKEWIEWFDDWQLSICSDGRIIPIIPARGNHEYSAKTLTRLFDLPDDAYYALSFGRNLLRFYTLNTEITMSGNQTDWLSQDLSGNCDVRWRMAQYHKPMRPHVSSKPEGISQYIYWAPLFYEYNMNVVIECDAHTVKTTWPIRPTLGAGNDEGFVRDQEFGTTFIGEGCWGAPLRANNDPKSWTRASDMFNQFKWLFVDLYQIDIQTVKVGTPEESESVASLREDNLFSIPQNLQLWEPSTGSLVTITSPLLSTEITYPLDGTHFPILPQKLTIDVAAFDGNGSIHHVDFYLNGNWMGSDAKAPYALSWTINQPGQYVLRAVATDNQGNKRYSCPVSLTADHSVLPPSWKSFTALPEGDNKVIVTWETAAGLDHAYYLIERAGMDQNYIALSRQEYLGDQIRGVIYKFEDLKPLPGLSYYRLRAVSHDKSYLFSLVREVKMPGKISSSVKAYPTPVGREKLLSIEFFTIQEQSINLHLFDQGGKEVVALTRRVRKGNNWFQLNPGPVAPGIYYLKIESPEEAFVRKVVFE